MRNYYHQLRDSSGQSMKKFSQWVVHFFYETFQKPFSDFVFFNELGIVLASVFLAILVLGAGVAYGAHILGIASISLVIIIGIGACFLFSIGLLLFVFRIIGPSSNTQNNGRAGNLPTQPIGRSPKSFDYFHNKTGAEINSEAWSRGRNKKK